MAVWQAYLDYCAFIHGILGFLAAAVLWAFRRTVHCGEPCYLVSRVTTRLMVAALLFGLQAWVLCASCLGADGAWCHLLRMMLLAGYGWMVLDTLRCLSGGYNNAWRFAAAAAMPALIGVATAAFGDPALQHAALTAAVLLPAAALVAAAACRRGICGIRRPQPIIVLLPLAMADPLEYASLVTSAHLAWLQPILIGAELAAILSAVALAGFGINAALSRRIPGELLRLQWTSRRRIVRITMCVVANVLLLTLPVMQAVQQHELERCRDGLVSRMAMAAALVDGEALSRVGPEANPTRSQDYLAVRRQLAAVLRATPGCEYVYTMREIRGVPRFLVDALPTALDTFSPPGQPYLSPTDEMAATLRGGPPAVETGFTSDAWGVDLSAYAVVRDSRGGEAGIVGADLSLAEWLLVARRVRLCVFLAALGVCLLVSAIGLTSYQSARARAAVTLYRSGLETSDAAVAITDHKHALVYANSAAGRLSTHIRGVPDDDTPRLLGAIDRDVRRQILATLTTQDRWQDEVAWSSDDAAVKYFRLTISCLRDGEDGVAGYVSVGLDVTERKELEQALRGSEAELRAANRRLAALLEEQYALTDKLSEQERELARIAQTDQLTGLLNRRAFDQLAERTLREAQARSRPFAIAVADLDHFKRVNDTFGHQVGDAVLSKVAELLRRSFRGADRVCRYGGEEFVVIMPDTDAEACMEACERARAAVQEQTGVSNGNTPSLLPPATITIGVAAYPGHGTTVTNLVAAADAALYVGKHLGRNRVCLFGARTAPHRRAAS